MLSLLIAIMSAKKKMKKRDLIRIGNPAMSKWFLYFMGLLKGGLGSKALRNCV